MHVLVRIGQMARVDHRHLAFGRFYCSSLRLFGMLGKAAQFDIQRPNSQSGQEAHQCKVSRISQIFHWLFCYPCEFFEFYLLKKLNVMKLN